MIDFIQTSGAQCITHNTIDISKIQQIEVEFNQTKESKQKYNLHSLKIIECNDSTTGEKKFFARSVQSFEGSSGIVYELTNNEKENEKLMCKVMIKDDDQKYQNMVTHETKITNVISKNDKIKDYIVDAKCFFLFPNDTFKIFVTIMPKFIQFSIYLSSLFDDNAKQDFQQKIIIRIIRAMHAFYDNGFVYTDVKKKNTVICNDEIYFCDLGSFFDKTDKTGGYPYTYCLQDFKNAITENNVDFTESLYLGFVAVLILDIINSSMEATDSIVNSDFLNKGKNKIKTLFKIKDDEHPLLKIFVPSGERGTFQTILNNVSHTNFTQVASVPKKKGDSTTSTS